MINSRKCTPHTKKFTGQDFVKDLADGLIGDNREEVTELWGAEEAQVISTCTSRIIPNFTWFPA
ncbi:hypothetical protein DPMN_099982 [Dreissena polymorpha]|uniref:Uncharacterized protein n=1 Tax=Dreissena polymorpha TaxID=45954 RepID=A0A9D4LF32_DREPO|nr:hypothetical protein DPMN_099982 [Dreissena polymorpha]